MKKCFLFFFLSIFFITPVWAIPVTDVDPPDVNNTYWEGSDQNPSLKNQLKNANETTEEAWLEGLLGKTYNDTSINLIDRIEAGSGGIGADVKGLTNYYPGFSWGYAVVKYGAYWAAYNDTGSEDLLTTGTLPFGVSHVTFFGNGTSVPEPGTLFLLGIGLVAVAGFGARRKNRK